ncbi:unnamed protein product [Agarophyton chilense]|eukprot:gb/GEZJ01001454.1/.p1 GENE.gb/GEZJ01001454.1/~~gb/GEZJ01001454.1/.p1  ORF type:complete len:246 (-),score=11.37 gb/GEZJ01001454.1/:205-858(-)
MSFGRGGPSRSNRRKIDDSLSFPVLRLHQHSSSFQALPPAHHHASSSASSAHLSAPRSYWDTVLSRGPAPEAAQQPSTPDLRSPPNPVSLDASIKDRGSGVTSSIFRKRSGSLGLVAEPIPDTRRSHASRPFACHLCKGRFERIGHLNAHIDAVHNSRKPYKCQYENCGKCFSHKSSLYRHVRGIHEKKGHKLPSASSPPPRPTPAPFRSMNLSKHR